LATGPLSDEEYSNVRVLAAAVALTFPGDFCWVYPASFLDCAGLLAHYAVRIIPALAIAARDGRVCYFGETVGALRRG
jgi:hypothetical protein